MATSSVSNTGPPTSFTASRISKTVFKIQEHDLYGEIPQIFAKIYSDPAVIVLSDTGCDCADGNFDDETYTHLRNYIESYPIPANDGKPLNPEGKMKYIIICTHCHFDHTLGLPQFAHDSDIVASASGRDFIESDLTEHGLFKYVGRPTPKYTVTKWANAFEKLSYPFRPASTSEKRTDLGITILATPGHTPDELAWYDEEEKHLYVGDSFYREGKELMPIVFPAQGSMIEWVFSMQKLAVFVRGENARLESAVKRDSDGPDWVKVARRVLVSCAHQTYAVDGAEILTELEKFAFFCFIGKVPVQKSFESLGEITDLWRESGEGRTPMSIQAPRRLIEDARRFFRSGEQAAEAESEARQPWSWAM